MENYTTGDLVSMLLELGKPTDGTKERLYARLLVENIDKAKDKFCKNISALSAKDQTICKRLKTLRKKRRDDELIGDDFMEELLLMSDKDYNNSMKIFKHFYRYVLGYEDDEDDDTFLIYPFLFELPEIVIKYFFDRFENSLSVFENLIGCSGMEDLIKAFGNEPPSSLKKLFNYLLRFDENSVKRNRCIKEFKDDILKGYDVDINKYLIKALEPVSRKEKREGEDDLSDLMSNLSSRPIKVPKSRK